MKLAEQAASRTLPRSVEHRRQQMERLVNESANLDPFNVGDAVYVRGRFGRFGTVNTVGQSKCEIHWNDGTVSTEDTDNLAPKES